MRKQIPVFLIIFLFIIGAQTWMVHAADDYDRVDPPLPEVSEPVALLDGKEVTEWTLNDTGQWEGSQVIIPRRWNDGQFNSITKVKVRIKNENYTGLIFSFTTGDYSYPQFGKGWYFFDYHYLYVFKPIELDKFICPKDMPKKPRQIKIDLLYKASAAEKSLLPRSLQRGVLNPDLKFEEKKVTKLQLRFNLLLLDDREIVRFTMLEAGDKSVGFSWWLRRVTHANLHANLFLDGKLLSPNTFKQSYYEVDFHRFNQVFGLKWDY